MPRQDDFECEKSTKISWIPTHVKEELEKSQKIRDIENELKNIHQQLKLNRIRLAYLYAEEKKHTSTSAKNKK